MAYPVLIIDNALEKVREKAKKHFNSLKILIYNPKTKEVLGRTGKSWLQQLAFFLVFNILLFGFFGLQLGIFIALTPSPGVDVTPWNYGRYGYYNYPNSKIGIMSIPQLINHNGDRPSLSQASKNRIQSLINSVSASSVNSSCIDFGDTDYGYSRNRSCVLLHIARVYKWTPESIQEFLPSEVTFGTHYDISCIIEEKYAHLGLDVTWSPRGFPLKLLNHLNGDSFPYSNIENYTTPVVGVKIDFTNLTLEENYKSFQMKITCGIDRAFLGIDEWSRYRISHIYELPSDAEIIIYFR